MRQVAVTEGDKVEAQLRFGVEVNGYGVSELVRRITEVSDAEVDRQVAQYEQLYTLAPALRQRRRSPRVAALCGPHRVGTAALSRCAAVSRPLPTPSKTCTG